MGMQVGSGSSSADPEVMIEMNMTPLIDVMLVLIIMLIITIPIQNHSVNLNMPTNQAAPKNPVEPVVVNIDVDFDGFDFETVEQVFGAAWQGFHHAVPVHVAVFVDRDGDVFRFGFVDLVTFCRELEFDRVCDYRGGNQEDDQ